MTALTPQQFDALTRKPEKLWGANEIAKALNLSPDTIQRLALDPAVPIYKPSGRYFAFRSELEAWLRSKPKA